MTNTIILLALSMSLLPASAKETPGQILQRLAGMGQGVHEVKSENGRLKSLKVVGQERISTVFGNAHGLQTAQTKASLKAKAAFVEWMASHVTYISQTTNETVAVLEGHGAGLKEQGKSTESVKETVIQQAAGMVRGLVLVGRDQDPETQLLTLVYSWSPGQAALTKDAQEGSSSLPGTLPAYPPAPATAPTPPGATRADAVTGAPAIPRRTLASPGIAD